MNSQHIVQPGIFSTSGRMDRLRYIAWNLVTAIVFISLGVVAFFIALYTVDEYSPPEATLLLMLPPALAVLVLKFIWSVRRTHDLNTSGWLSLIILIPLGELVFWFIPGTRGENRFGPTPPASEAGTLVTIVFSLVALVVMGFIADNIVESIKIFLQIIGDASDPAFQGGSTMPQ